MSDVFTILKKIQTRPGIYIGRASVSDMFMFIVGYRTAREEMGLEPTETELEFYGEFQPWLQNRFKLSTARSWAEIIQFHYVNEKEAFEQFFSLLEEFLRRGDLTEEDREKPVEQVTV